MRTKNRTIFERVITKKTDIAGIERIGETEAYYKKNYEEIFPRIYRKIVTTTGASREEITIRIFESMDSITEEYISIPV